MDKKYNITESGLQALEAELAKLKGQRIAMAEKIANARGFGDLSENAEYDAAREEQGIMETRIAEIEDILQNATIIKAADSTKVGLGSVVDLEANGKQVTYTVVGLVEANPLEGKISNESPIGQALMNKSVGDQVIIKTPKGEISYTVIGLR